MLVSIPAWGQGEGFNATWITSSPNTTGGMPNYSTAWWSYIDATPYNTGDLCSTINTILIVSPGVESADGIVIDARGISPAHCAASPWSTNSSWPWATILLPPGIIQISSTWQLPEFTRLIGEGPGVTTIQATSGFGNGNGIPNPAPMVQMGGTGNCGNGTDCQGIVIEHLTLDGNNSAEYGISNNFAQELSYVNDVALNNINGTGLYIESPGGQPPPNDGNNSGPYTNIYCSNDIICAQIEGTTGTRGIHGLTANWTKSGVGGVAVYVDAANNTIEDAYISNYDEGIRIGSQGPAPDNTLINISGGGSQGVEELIHIFATTSSSSTCPVTFAGTTPDNVCDLTIIAAANPGTNTVIQDDLNSSTAATSYVGLYTLGEQFFSYNNANLGHTRFTTAPGGSADTNLANWSFGAGNPTGSGCSVGSLYSCTGAGGASCTYTLWGCASGSVWKKIF
jgi:hypothetical protein